MYEVNCTIARKDSKRGEKYGKLLRIKKDTSAERCVSVRVRKEIQGLLRKEIMRKNGQEK